jgi:cytochrome c
MRKWCFALALAAVATWGWAVPAPTIASAQTPSAGQEAQEEEQDWQGLPPGKGREEVFYACAPCHSLRLVTQQGLSRARWDQMLDWMVAKQAMPEVAPEDRKLIIDYLAEFYGEDRKAKGGPSRRRRQIP